MKADAELFDALLTQAKAMSKIIEDLRGRGIYVSVDNRSAARNEDCGPVSIKIAWTSGSFIQ